MHKCLFDIPDSGRLPISVMTFINKLVTNKQANLPKTQNYPLRKNPEAIWAYIIYSDSISIIPYKPDICYKYDLFLFIIVVLLEFWFTQNKWR